ncbi:MAG: 2-C-methyl-D-erythritol 4-phosphate cytidylyltransferase [Spirosomataceae bacterium]|jgi:2-C-methyl-D-erythritol 4-phosphate cytidylyltransferase
MSEKYAIIVAGGSGSRMKSEMPKQFLLLGGIPILVRTLQTFLSIENLQVILVLPQDSIAYWQNIKGDYFTENHKIITVMGGNTRFQSVRNGLNSISDQEGLVAVHDGVRPFISKEIIENSFLVAGQKGSAVVAVDSKDSVRLMKNEKNRAVDRNTVKLIQTPQTFDLGLLKKAFLTDEKPFFTDDASVVEYFGHEIFLVEGDYRNIKITTPEDILIGETFLRM